MENSIAFADRDTPMVLSLADRRDAPGTSSAQAWSSGVDRDASAFVADSMSADGEICSSGRLHLGSFSSWRRFVQDQFPWLSLPVRGKPGFHASVTTYRVGLTRFATIEADACEAQQFVHRENADHRGCIKVIWQTSGRIEVEQDGKSFRLGPGQVGVCDTARPYRMRIAGRAGAAVLLLPYDAFPGWAQIGPEICGRSIDQSIATRAALAALNSLNGLPADVVAEQGGPVLTAVKWMLSNSLRASDPAAAEGLGGCATLIAKARRHIVEHASNPELGPDQVASALCISRRSLFLLFKRHRMTPSRMIRDVRLDQAKRSLEDPGQAHQKMTHIAFDAGFVDHATFSRLFKAQFGVTPSEFRSQHCLALCA